MNKLVRIFDTSIGCKAVMALTGLGLLLFVIGHMLGNLQIYRGQEAYNNYAHMLKSMGPWLWVARLGLLGIFSMHIYSGLRLYMHNCAARPTRYVYQSTRKASLASRYMMLTGVLVLFFVIYHLAHFTFGFVGVTSEQFNKEVDVMSIHSGIPAGGEIPTEKIHDVYSMFIASFQVPWIAVSYILFMLALGAHLSHGVASMFQTVGINHPAYNTIIRYGSYGLVGLIVLGNCLMPLSIVLGIYPIGGK